MTSSHLQLLTLVQIMTTTLQPSAPGSHATGTNFGSGGGGQPPKKPGATQPDSGHYYEAAVVQGSKQYLIPAGYLIAVAPLPGAQWCDKEGGYWCMFSSVAGVWRILILTSRLEP